MTTKDPRFTRRPDPDERLASALVAIRALLSARDRLREDHLKELLSVCLWKVTEAESPHKHKTRYRSASAIACNGKGVQHDHVFERRKLVDEILRHPERSDQIALSAIGCTVTKDEHRALTLQSHRDATLDGWSRYHAAGIEVIDLSTGQPLSTA